MKRKKSLSFIFSLLICFVFFSCNNLDLNYSTFKNDENGKTDSNFSPENIDGKQQVTINIVSLTDGEKSVGWPDFESLKQNIKIYEVTATAESKQPYCVDVDAQNPECKLLLDLNVNWNIVVNAYDNVTKSPQNLVMTGENTFKPSAGNTSVTITVKPYQDKSTGGATGGIKLKINFPSSALGYSVDWYAGEKQGAAITVSPAGGDTEFSLTGITPGTSRITMDIKDNATHQVVKKIFSIVVYSNVTSSKWIDSGIAKNEISFESSELVHVKSDENFVLYVVGTTGSGTISLTDDEVKTTSGSNLALKFSTVQKAVDFIESVDPSGLYEHTIYIAGKVTLASGGAKEDSMVCIGDSTNGIAPKITIKGYDTGTQATLDGQSYGRVLKINNTSGVTVSGVDFTSTKINVAGTSVFIGQGNVVLENSTISCMQATQGGIYISKESNVVMKNCSVSAGTNNRFSLIYLMGNLTLEEKNNFYDNSHDSVRGIELVLYETGNGKILLSENASSYIEGGIISNITFSDRQYISGQTVMTKTDGSALEEASLDLFRVYEPFYFGKGMDAGKLFIKTLGHEYYVNKNYSGTIESGFKDEPFKTVQNAVNDIVLKNDGEEYTIYVMDNIIGSSGAVYGSNGYALVNIDNSTGSRKLKLKICSDESGAQRTISVNRTAPVNETTMARVISVKGEAGKEVELTLEDIRLWNGILTGNNYGAGILISDYSTVTLGTKFEESGNVSIKGSGIYCAGGSSSKLVIADITVKVSDEIYLSDGSLIEQKTGGDDLSNKINIDAEETGTLLARQVLSGGGDGSYDFSNFGIYTLLNGTYCIDSNGKITDEVSTVASCGENLPSACKLTLSTKAELNQISTWVADKKNLANFIFVMTGDIELEGSEEAQFTPIGNNNSPFAGIFDGNGHTITGLYINSDSNFQGLFVYCKNGCIKNVCVKGKVTGKQYIGGICGYLVAGVVENCVSYVDVSGTHTVGGICGQVYSDSTIKNCINLGKITGTNANIGGISGFGNISQISNCANLGEVTGNSYYGGILGYGQQFTIDYCYNAGPVTGNCICGSTTATISNCYYFTGCGTAQTGATEKPTPADIKTALDSTPYNKWDYSYVSGGNTYPVCVEIPASFMGTSVASCGDTAPESGTYFLSTPAELKKISEWTRSGSNGIKLQNCIFVMTKDIDLEGNESDKFTPIGPESKPFAGTFDGAGYTVKGLYVNSTSDYQGLFGQIKKATIKNLTVEGVVNGGSNCGGICGFADSAGNLVVIENCVSNVEVSGTSYIGGICGEHNDGEIRNCVNVGEITGSGIDIGGIAGYSQKIVKNCANFGTVSGSNNVGGIDGYISTGYSICNCYNAGKISGTNAVGYISGDSTTDANVESNAYVDISGTGLSSYGNNSGEYASAVSYSTSQISNLKDALNYWVESNSTYNTWDKTVLVNGVEFPVCVTVKYEVTVPVNGGLFGTATGGQTQGSKLAETYMSTSGNLTVEGAEISKTSEVAVVPAGMSALVAMTDDSSWSLFYAETESKYKGVFIKDRKVKLDAFSMGQYPVTQSLYNEVMGTNPSNFAFASVPEDADNLPVESVSWYDACAFCNELTKKTIGEGECVYFSDSEKTAIYTKTDAVAEKEVYIAYDSTSHKFTKKGYRLPTEAEWEFAARGGNPNASEWKYAYAGNQTAKTTSEFTSSGSDAGLDNYGWYTNNSSLTSHEAGLKTSNRLNLFDMSGNVYEWCWDGYNETADANDDIYKNAGSGEIENPLGDSSSVVRVLRGGSWTSSPWYCAVSYRNNYNPDDIENYRGIRVVRSL